MMRITTMFRRFALILAGYAFMIASGEASSQGYPNKSIRFIVPSAAGGPADAVARMIAQRLSEGFAQQVVVDNRVGANGIIGTELVAKAPPDGYTLVGVSNSFTINPSIYKKLPYDTLKDFAPIALATSGPLLLVVHPSVPVNDLKSLLGLVRAKPGELTGASAGSGSTAHLALELLNYMAGTKIVHVPYKGSAQAVTDVIGGHVSMYFTNMVALLPPVKSGKLKGLAVSTLSRSEAAPDIPTVAEAGIPGYDVSIWLGILATAGTPKEIISRLNAEIVRQLRSPDMREKLAPTGAMIVASTPEQFSSYIVSEIPKWEKVIKVAGIKAD